VAVAAATGRSGALALIVGLWQIAGHMLVAPAGVPALAATMLATTVLAGVLVAMLALGGLLTRTALPASLISRAAALRTKSWSAAFIRQHDPDAAGRSRPRAPSTGQAAA
jgi:Family of unknown function (DUF6412)